MFWWTWSLTYSLYARCSDILKGWRFHCVLNNTKINCFTHGSVSLLLSWFHGHPNPLSPSTRPQTLPALLGRIFWNMISKATVARAKNNTGGSVTVTAQKCSLADTGTFILQWFSLWCTVRRSGFLNRIPGLDTCKMKLRKRLFICCYAACEHAVSSLFISFTTAPISSSPLWIPPNMPPVQQRRCLMVTPITLPLISDSARQPGSNQVSTEVPFP